MTIDRKIKVLIVDDSAIVRKILVETLAGERDIEVVGTAPDPYIARDKIVALNPDVLTLDIEMPRMDGLTFLGKLMQHHPLPVVIISSLAQSSCNIAVEALRIGAMEVLAKPAGPTSVGELRTLLASKIRTAASGSVSARPALTQPPSTAKPTAGAKAPVAAAVTTNLYSSSDVVAIGASTGGVAALQQVLTQMPAAMPPILVTQHIPAVFSKAFADRLHQLCELSVKEAEDGDVLRPGHVLLAPGDRHMIMQRGASGYVVAIKDGPQVCYQRPSVDVLFHSVARVAGQHAVGVILTGMGADGADGLLAMKKAGAHTIAQDEASSVVFGMPKEAIHRGAVDEVYSLTQIASAVQAALGKKVRAR